MVAEKGEDMAMSVALPVQPILELFKQNHTEALSLVATCGCCSRMQPGMDYDHDADVLYVNFQRPVASDHSEMDDSDTILRYQGDRMVGFTILNASHRT